MMYEEDLFENNVFEGGKLLASDRIRGDIAQDIATFVIEKLKAVFPGQRVEPSGSTMKKTPSEYCGDIDITVDSEYSEENEQKVVSFIEQNFPNSRYEAVPAFHMISFEFPFDEEGERKIAQVDVKLTDVFDWVQKVTFSAPSSETKFKSMAKNMLISVIASTQTYEEPELFTDDDYAGTKYQGLYTGQVKNKVTKSMDGGAGFFKSYKTCAGKRKKQERNVFDANGEITTIPRFEGVKDEFGKSKRELITTNYDEALKSIFGPEATMDQLNTVEKIVDYIFSGKFQTSPENLNEIYESFIYHLMREKKSHPESEADFRENELIDTMIENFKSIWGEHKGATPLNESRCSRFGMKMNDLVRRMNLL